MAVTATTVWEVQTGGNDTFGGGFDPTVTSPGTNYSLTAPTVAQVTFNGTTITATTVGAGATITITGYTVATTDNGNVLIISAGTNFTAGSYTIISVDTGLNTWTLNANVTTGAGTGMVGKMGGAKLTLTAPVKVAGNKIWVKAGTYNVGASQALNVAGTSLAWIVHEGYTTTHGDGGKATIARTSGTTFSVINITAAFNAIYNFICDGGSAASMTGISLSAANTLGDNCKVLNCTSSGFAASQQDTFFRNCWVIGQTTTAGFNITSECTLTDCQASGGTCTGFLFNLNSANVSISAIRCISANNTGGSSCGFRVANSMTVRFEGCIAYGNGSDGFLFDTTAAATCLDGSSSYNCVAILNGGYGVNANAANVPFFPIDYFFTYSNTSGARNNFPTGSHDVALSGDPYTSSTNFALNNTAGAGAAVRAAGFPGVLQFGGTGYTDAGALPHQDSGGGTVISVNVSNVAIMSRLGISSY